MIHFLTPTRLDAEIQRITETVDEVTKLVNAAEFYELSGEDGKAAEIRERLRKLGV